MPNDYILTMPNIESLLFNQQEETIYVYFNKESSYFDF